MTTITLYEEIEKESGMDASMHITGGVMLADTSERMDWLKMSHARGRYLGMETELISAEEAQELLPILDPQYFVGAMWDAHEGHLDPSQITHAYLECARNRGAGRHIVTRGSATSPAPPTAAGTSPSTTPAPTRTRRRCTGARRQRRWPVGP